MQMEGQYDYCRGASVRLLSGAAEATHQAANRGLRRGEPHWEHGNLDARALGVLPEGATVVTVGKLGGQLIALASRTFYGKQLPVPADVLNTLRKVFR